MGARASTSKNPASEATGKQADTSQPKNNNDRSSSSSKKSSKSSAASSAGASSKSEATSKAKPTSLYAVLGLEKGASDEAIKKAYRKAALEWHPDKHLDDKAEAEEKFKEVAQAYHVLGNAERKKAYDEGGEAGLEKAGRKKERAERRAAKAERKERNPDSGSTGNQRSEEGNRNDNARRAADDDEDEDDMDTKPSVDPHEVFSSFFKSTISRYEALKGAAYDRMFGDDDQEDDEGFDVNCSLFDHLADVTRMKALGGFFQAGKENRPRIHHIECTLEELFHGAIKRKTIRRKSATLRRDDEVILEVAVKPGWKAGMSVTFPGEGSELGGTGKARDVVLVIEEVPHRYFTREGSDLVFHATVPAIAAARGFQLSLPTLDGQTVSVTLGEVNNTTVKLVRGMGMPSRKRKGARGDMVITFDIVKRSAQDFLRSNSKEHLRPGPQASNNTNDMLFLDGTKCASARPAPSRSSSRMDRGSDSGSTGKKS